MNDISHIISCLKKTPQILAGFLSQIPEELLEAKRIKDSWSIHEHACHIATGDRIGFIDRLHQFISADYPSFVPLSGESFPLDYLQNIDMGQALDQFVKDRTEAVLLAKSLDPALWAKEGKHPEYTTFTPYIMLRHRLMHDHLHMYRIEELWLTRKQNLQK